MAFYEWRMDDRPNGKCLRAKKLKELLAEVPDDCLVVTSPVGNLALYHGSPLGRQMCDGVIDFGFEEVSLSPPGKFGPKEIDPLIDLRRATPPAAP